MCPTDHCAPADRIDRSIRSEKAHNSSGPPYDRNLTEQCIVALDLSIKHVAQIFGLYGGGRGKSPGVPAGVPGVWGFPDNWLSIGPS